MALTGHVLICPGLGLACSRTEGRAAQGNGDSVMGDLGGTGCTSRDGTASLGGMQDERSGTVTVRVFSLTLLCCVPKQPGWGHICHHTEARRSRLGLALPDFPPQSVWQPSIPILIK